MAQEGIVVSNGNAGEVGMLQHAADVLFRRKKFIGALTVAWMIALLVYVMATPREYETEAMLLVKNERTDVLITPERTAGGVVRSDVNEAQIATEVQLLSSLDMLRTVVQKCSLASRESQRRGAAVAQDDAIARLRRDLKIAPVVKADLIKLKYSSADPEQGVNVLRALINLHMDRHVSIRHNGGAYPFFEQQAKLYETQLREAQAELAGYQQRTKIVLLDQQKDVGVRKIADLEAALREATAARQDSMRQVEVLRQQLASTPSRITTQSRRLPNQYSVERLNTMLAELQNKRTELLTKFNSDDRLVQQLDRQIRDTQTALGQANSISSTEEASDVNPLRQATERQLAQAQVAAESARVRATVLQQQIQESRGGLSGLGQASMGYENLARRVKELEENYTLYAKKREEARISEEMDRQKIANVSVAEAPSVPLLPGSRFNGGLLGTLLLGVALILGLAYLTSPRRHTFETPWELESFTGLPVLATVAYSKAHRTQHFQYAPADRQILASENNQ